MSHELMYFDVEFSNVCVCLVLVRTCRSSIKNITGTYSNDSPTALKV